MSATINISFESFTGKKITRDVHQTIDITKFVDCAIYPFLLMTANPHLSAPDLMMVLIELGAEGTFRPDGWIRRRRWMTQPNPTTLPGRRLNADGEDARAIRIMQANSELSLRNLVRVLKERGINRGREWVRMHRCDVGV